jgi:hypothetical protein
MSAVSPALGLELLVLRVKVSDIVVGGDTVVVANVLTTVGGNIAWL